MRTKRTPEKMALFLGHLAETASVTRACQLSNLGRANTYEWRNEDPAFAAAWDEALKVGTDALEDEAIRRAHEGYDEPVYQGGQQVGTVRRYSDTLLIFMLKGRRPEKFKDRQELTGANGGPVEVHNTVSADADAAAMLQSIADAVAKRSGASGDA